MPRLADKTVSKPVKKDIRQKIIVAEGGQMSSNVPYKVIYTEYVESAQRAKERIEELKKEYTDKSISYFSV